MDRPRPLPRWILAGALAATLAGEAPASAQGAPPCQQVVLLRGYGQLEDAKAAALLLESKDATGDCAAEQLKQIKADENRVKASLKAAKAAEGRDPDRAARLYREALRIDANSSEARKGLAAVLAPVTPVPTPVKTDKSFFEEREDQADDWLANLKGIGTWAGAALAWIAAGIVASLVLLRGLRWMRRDGPGDAFASRLTVSAFDAGDEKLDGAGVAAVLAARLAGAPGGWRGGVDQHVASPEAADVLKELTTALSGFGAGKVASALLPLIRSLIPRTSIIVQGRVVEGREGFGMVVSLVEGRGRVLASQTFLQRDYGPPAADEDAKDGDADTEQDKAEKDTSTTSPAAILERLAAVAAVWLQHKLHDLGLLETLDGRPSEDWASDAYVTAGAEASKDPASFRAGLFAKAVSLDPSNDAASFDLAITDLRDGRWSTAQERLEAIVASLEKRLVLDADSAAGARTDLLWFKAKYNLAVVALGGHDRPLARVAYRHARALLIRLAEAIEAAPNQQLDDDDLPGRGELHAVAARLSDVVNSPDLNDEQREHLMETQQTIVRMYRTMRVDVADPEQRRAHELRRIEAPALVLLADVLLLLGRYSPETGHASNLWREHLAAALAQAPTSDEAIEQEYLQTGRIIDIVKRGTDVWRDYRADYNLACVYSRAAERVGVVPHADRALDVLSSVVATSAQLAAWAQIDPSLRWLGIHRADVFWPLVGGTAPSTDLANLHAVGSGLGVALKDAGISTVGELLERIDKVGTTGLASKLEVPDVLVTRWRGLAELCELPGITIEEANLLDEADVQTRRQLSALSPAQLQRLLRVSAERDSMVDVPPLWELEGWIEAAKRSS